MNFSNVIGERKMVLGGEENAQPFLEVIKRNVKLTSGGIVLPEWAVLNEMYFGLVGKMWTIFIDRDGFKI